MITATPTNSPTPTTDPTIGEVLLFTFGVSFAVTVETNQVLV